MNYFLSLGGYLKRHKILAGGCVIILLITVYIFRPKPPTPIPTVRVVYGNIVSSISTSGKIAANNFVDLSFVAAGKMIYLGIKLGDHVSKNQIIAQEDPRTAQKNLRTSLIAYAKQRDTFDQTNDNNQNRTPAQALNDQMKRVLQDNQYDLNTAINSVELASIAQENSVLTSPIDGIVTRTDETTAGVNVLTTTVFEVTDPNSLVFNMDVDEADVGKVKLKQKVTLTLDSYPDEILTLPVRFIDYTSHQTSTGGTAYIVQVPLVDETAQKYRVGMDGNAQIITGEKDHVLKIPATAVTEDSFVYVKKSTHFVKRKVVLGMQSDSDAEVLHGLSEGETIAAQPLEASTQTKN